MSEDAEVCHSRDHDSLNGEKWEENQTSLFWSHPFSFKIALQTILFSSSSSRQSLSNRPLESAAQVKVIPVYPFWRNECSECQNALWSQIGGWEIQCWRHVHLRENFVHKMQRLVSKDAWKFIYVLRCIPSWLNYVNGPGRQSSVKVNRKLR